MARSPDLIELIRRMQVSNEACSSQLIDLTEYRFRCDDSSMWLENAKGLMGSEKLSFRMDPARPKDLDINLGISQFCKVLKIPATFFRDNRPQLRETFVRNWVAALPPGEPQSQFQVRTRRGSELLTIRAFLPMHMVDLPNYRVLDALLPEIEGVHIDLVSSSGDTQDCRVLEAEVLVGDRFMVKGEPFRLGMHIEASDLGCSDIRVEAFVTHADEGWSLMLSFSMEPLLVSRYRGIQPRDLEAMLREVLPDLLSRIPSIQEAADSVNDADFPGLASCLDVVCRGLPRDMAGVLRRKVEADGNEVGEDGEDKALDEHDHPMFGFYKFARGVSKVAEDTQGAKRVALERAAGMLLQLNLKKK